VLKIDIRSAMDSASLTEACPTVLGVLGCQKVKISSRTC
jgi:hypothetical protein